MKIRVLVLDDDNLDVLVRRFEAAGVELEVTCETKAELWDSDGGWLRAGAYQVSERSLQLAREASPAKYDAVVVGNNLGTGVAKARTLPHDLRARTFIAWNEPPRGVERPYAKMGFSHFGQRYCLRDEGGVDIEDFLKEVASEMAAI